ncbi:hypothetical protein GCM10017744_082330 [Streptomyces antimycoticus]|uniref:Uncharacterized protein n=1 Tax=Streptomyces antimycoticus TaxID=68175 RepID=A0A4D4K3X4_9ACTN|nr:hypothetical protein [Streptomyces antimycoticus]GDY41019.1 hypothetical protein SANT12839_019010 [Streptomyces antimycoticus]
MVSKTIDYVQDHSAPTGLIVVNMAIGIVELVVLATGALLLFQHKMAGRRMIAATGGVVALHNLSAGVQYKVVGGPPGVELIAYVVGPLTAALAIAAVVMAALPSTGHWCRRAAGHGGVSGRSGRR